MTIYLSLPKATQGQPAANICELCELSCEASVRFAYANSGLDMLSSDLGAVDASLLMVSPRACMTVGNCPISRRKLTQ